MKKKKFSVTIFWLQQLLALIVMIACIYMYKKYEPKWYIFTIGFITMLIVMVVINSFNQGNVTKDENIAGTMGIGMASLSMFFIKPLHYRIIAWICLISGANAFLKELTNHDKNGSFRSNQTRSWVHMICSISFIYYAVKTNGFSRWVNIFLVCISAMMFKSEEDHIEGIKEYDRQEDDYNSSTFARATNKSFESVMNDKGLGAEYATSTWLTDINDHYRVLHNLYTPAYEKRYVSEIDTLVITTCGIIVLEVKNQRKSWIISGESKNDAKAIDQYGNVLQENQSNPFRQNRIHVENLKHLMDQSPTMKKISPYVYGYVVFGPETNGAQIRNVVQGYCSYNKIGEMINKENKKSDILGERAIDTLYKLLKKYENNPELKRQHERTLGYR